MSKVFDPNEWSVPASHDPAAWQRAVILRNVEKDPSYAPYCMRCPGLRRMRVVDRRYWRCGCGAECDYRPSSLPAS